MVTVLLFYSRVSFQSLRDFGDTLFLCDTPGNAERRPEGKKEREGISACALRGGMTLCQ